MTTYKDFFEQVTDPRGKQGKQHQLTEIIILTIYALIIGANSWYEIEFFCSERIDSLRKFLPLKNGIPSHDTFQRVFSKLDPKQLNNSVTKWMLALLGSFKNKHISLDGKTVRKSFDKAKNKFALHILNVFVVDSLTVIRQVVGDKKDSEITMIETIFDGIDITDSTVTIDAIGCQEKIIKYIRKKKANYLIALKANQPNLHNEVIDYFKFAQKKSLKKGTFDIYQTIDKGHGRIENRSYFCLDTKHYPLQNAGKFTDLKTIIRVHRVREVQGEQNSEYSYYISSLECNAENIGKTIRGHWAIENSLHHILDIIYKEDDNRTRKDHAPANFSLMRKVSMNLINMHKEEKTGQKRSRIRGLFNPSYAEKLFIGTEIIE